MFVYQNHLHVVHLDLVLSTMPAVVPVSTCAGGGNPLTLSKVERSWRSHAKETVMDVDHHGTSALDLPTLILDKTMRITPTTSLFEFSIHNNTNISETYRLGQYITLQFPPDLDPIGGSRTLSDADRKLSFTPCKVCHGGGSTRISFLAKNGRVTGLIGLPRPNGPLTSMLLEVGGGFSRKALSAERMACVAGGTGIACFAAMGHRKTGLGLLIHSIGAEEFDLFLALLDSNVLQPDAWTTIHVFITPGLNQYGGRSAQWWPNRLANLHYPANIHFALGRMSESEFQCLRSAADTILFCGSRSLEWQIKMWAMKDATVHTTR